MSGYLSRVIKKATGIQNKHSKQGWAAQVPMSLTIMQPMLPLNSYDYHLPSVSADQLQVQRELGQVVRCFPLARFMLLPGALGLQGMHFCFLFPPADFHSLTLLSPPLWACPCLSICVANPVASKMVNKMKEEESICSLWTDCSMWKKDPPTHY